jgi:type II secretion system protein G
MASSTRKPALQLGFTLIELLIVVAIIGILSAIAIPNFLQARIRAKIGRVHADQRSFATAVEAYAVDWGGYPRTDDIMRVHNPDAMEDRWVPFTTPMAYINSIPEDPFGDPVNPSWVVNGPRGWEYRTYDFVSAYDRLEPTKYGHDQFLVTLINYFHLPKSTLWYMTSQGPDEKVSVFQAIEYDPTNGLLSQGDIFKFGP